MQDEKEKLNESEDETRETLVKWPIGPQKPLSNLPQDPSKRGPKYWEGPSEDVPAAEEATSHGKGRGRNPWLNKDLLIVPLREEPVKVRRDTNRWRNQKVVLDSHNVREALDRLSQLKSPGSAADIRLAVKNQVIELKEPSGEA